MAKQVDGIVFMGNDISDEVRKKFERSKTPIVLAGCVDDQDKMPSVNIDYTAAVEEATKNLIDHGNERVAFVSGSLDYPINRDYRLKGYKQALKKRAYGMMRNWFLKPIILIRPANYCNRHCNQLTQWLQSLVTMN